MATEISLSQDEKKTDIIELLSLEKSRISTKFGYKTFQLGKLHSFNDEPAHVYQNFKAWYKDGKKHRETKDNDGMLLPAYTSSYAKDTPISTVEFYLEGKRVEKDGTEFITKLLRGNSDISSIVLRPTDWYTRPIVSRYSDGKIPFTSGYSSDYIMFAIKSFEPEWTGSNLYRKCNVKITDIFSEYEISVLSSAKKNQNYTLYRGIKFEGENDKTYQRIINEGVYKDEYPTSWSLNVNHSRRYANIFDSYHNNQYTKGIVMKVVVPTENVLIDLGFVGKRSSQEEVILLPNEYKVEIFEEMIHKKTNSKKPELIPLRSILKKSLGRKKKSLFSKIAETMLLPVNVSTHSLVESEKIITEILV